MAISHHSIPSSLLLQNISFPFLCHHKFSFDLLVWHLLNCSIYSIINVFYKRIITMFLFFIFFFWRYGSWTTIKKITHQFYLYSFAHRMLQSKLISFLLFFNFLRCILCSHSFFCYCCSCWCSCSCCCCFCCCRSDVIGANIEIIFCFCKQLKIDQMTHFLLKTNEMNPNDTKMAN